MWAIPVWTSKRTPTCQAGSSSSAQCSKHPPEPTPILWQSNQVVHTRQGAVFALFGGGNLISSHDISSHVLLLASSIHLEVRSIAEAGKSVGPEIEYEHWSEEIRRGALSLAILAIILDGESYGYDIMKKLNDEGYSALQVEPSTTYPLLKRLEQRGMLEGKWVESGGKKRRLYYVTREGRMVLRRMVESWQGLNDQLVRLLKEAALI